MEMLCCELFNWNDDLFIYSCIHVQSYLSGSRIADDPSFVLINSNILKMNKNGKIKSEVSFDEKVRCRCKSTEEEEGRKTHGKQVQSLQT